MMQFDSIAAVVTGGASGLGRATAEALIGRGARVALFDFNEEVGQATANEIGALFCKVDVTSNTQVEAAFAQARAAHGQERVLVACAGTGTAAKTVGRDKKTGILSHFPLDAFDRTIQVNLVGTFRCLAMSALGMAQLDPVDEHGERGAIVTTASCAAVDGQVGQAAYSASKAGIMGMTLPIARDLMDIGIRINSILPGIFDTPMLAQLPPAIHAALATSVPFPKRLGRPSEYANLAMFLINNGYMNGEAVRLDGAIRMQPR